MFTTECEFRIELIYDYEPAEPRTRTDPGCDADIDVWGIKIEGAWLTDEQFETLWAGIPESTKEQWLEAIHKNEEEKIRDKAELDAEYAEEYRAEARAEQRQREIQSSPLFEFGVSLGRLYQNLHY